MSNTRVRYAIGTFIDGGEEIGLWDLITQQFVWIDDEGHDHRISLYKNSPLALVTTLPSTLDDGVNTFRRDADATTSD